MRTLAGVDGCKRGWIAAVEHAGGRAELRVFPDFAALLAALPDDAVIAIDMPIGLPERIEGPGRAAEKAVRPFLGARRSSVFSIPARAAVEAWNGPHGDEAARRTRRPARAPGRSACRRAASRARASCCFPGSWRSTGTCAPTPACAGGSSKATRKRPSPR